MVSLNRLQRLVEFSRANFKKRKGKKYPRVKVRLEPRRALYPLGGAALGATALGGLGAAAGYGLSGRASPHYRPIDVAAIGGAKYGLIGAGLGSIGGLGYLTYKNRKRKKKYSHRLLDR